MADDPLSSEAVRSDLVAGRTADAGSRQRAQDNRERTRARATGWTIQPETLNPRRDREQYNQNYLDNLRKGNLSSQREEFSRSTDPWGRMTAGDRADTTSTGRGGGKAASTRSRRRR